MVAQAWVVFNKAKKKMCNTTLNLAATTFRMSLLTSTWTPNLTLSVYEAVRPNEVTEANGYSSSGKALTTERWTVGSTTTQYMFDVDDVVWTGTGGAINGIKYAVIWLSAATTAGRHLLCYSQLTSGQFNLAQNNTLTIQINSAGVLTLQ